MLLTLQMFVELLQDVLQLFDGGHFHALNWFFEFSFATGAGAGLFGAAGASFGAAA